MTVMQQVQYIVLTLIIAYFWFTVVTFLEEKPPLLPSLASQENDPLFLSLLWFTLPTKKFRCPNVILNTFLWIWLETENSFLVERHVVSSGSVLKNLFGIVPISELSHLLQKCHSNSRVVDAAQCCCCGACGLCTAPRASESAQVVSEKEWIRSLRWKKSPHRNVWWDLHCWMASGLTLMTKWHYHLYNLCCVYYKALFPPHILFWISAWS